MTGPSLRRRRLLTLLGAGTAAALSGCNALFTEPEGEATATATSTETPTPTATPTPTPANTTATAARGVVPVEVGGYDISFEEVLGDFVAATVDVDLTTTGDRTVREVELRVAMVYDPTGDDRTVVVDYVGRRFGDGDDDEGLSLTYRTRFPADDRADGSTDPDDFALRFRITRLELT